MNLFVRCTVPFFLLAACHATAQPVKAGRTTKEMYRPSLHFSPDSGWMNDPNGMVFFNNEYHLFFQHYPDSNVWGPMHWGHATSADLVHWKQQPIALYPDSIGYIFSGSAVVDKNNTSGFAKNGEIPLVAMFTSHDMVKEKAGKTDVEAQSIAYSVDGGKTWTKYQQNPVIKNAGIRDFRDPKVGWNAAVKKWIVTLATQDCVTFYSSSDLKNWTKETEFGKHIGNHGGVWECPDLFPMYDGAKQVWVLLVSVNPGGPNGGSATQYFTGNFDGKTFTPNDTITRWLDYGPDNYAGVTFSNNSDKKILIGWMNNWIYANQVPTKRWRGAATIPRDLSLVKQENGYLLASKPVAGFDGLAAGKVELKDIDAKQYDVSAKAGGLQSPCRIDIATGDLQDFSLVLSNTKGEKLVIGYDKNSNEYFIDRSASGIVSFNEKFAAKHVAPRLSAAKEANISLIIDEASVELFADGGVTVMTSVFFPTEKYKNMALQSLAGLKIDKLVISKLVQ